MLCVVIVFCLQGYNGWSLCQHRLVMARTDFSVLQRVLKCSSSLERPWPTSFKAAEHTSTMHPQDVSRSVDEGSCFL